MLFASDICANKKAPPTHSVYWGLDPSPTQKHKTPSFAKSPLKSEKYPSPSLLGDSLPHTPLPPQKKIFV